MSLPLSAVAARKLAIQQQAAVTPAEEVHHDGITPADDSEEHLGAREKEEQETNKVNLSGEDSSSEENSIQIEQLDQIVPTAAHTSELMLPMTTSKRRERYFTHEAQALSVQASDTELEKSTLEDDETTEPTASTSYLSRHTARGRHKKRNRRRIEEATR